MFVDSHCHLSFPELAGDLEDILADMAKEQVDRALVICTTIEEFEVVHRLANEHSNLWATVGVHPDNENVHEPTVDDLLQRAARARVVAIGETGLDYYRLDGRSVADMDWQRQRFRTHIRAAIQARLPLVIHTRSASADTLEILRVEDVRSGTAVSPGVFHCFTETMEVARAALDMGFFISFSGILTFRNADELRRVARFVPLDRLLIETDSPYLSPVPFRGKTNTPARVPWVARAIAEQKSQPVEVIAWETSRNFERLFGIARAAEVVDQ